MRRAIDLNADVGESFGHWRFPQTEAVVQQVTTAQVACGWHAGDPSVMRETVGWCKQYGAALAAHVGFPDLQGFGRRMMVLTNDEAYDAILYQVGALKAFADQAGLPIYAATPHGQFGEWALESEERAEVMVAAFQDAIETDVTMHLPPYPDSPLNAVAKRRGAKIVNSFYPGLEYDDNGVYVLARDFDESGVVESTLAITAHWLDTGCVESVTGNQVEVPGDSIVFHGDVPTAPDVLAGIRRLCEERDIEIRALRES